MPKIRNPGSNGWPALISAKSATTDDIQGKDIATFHASALGLHLKKLMENYTQTITEQNHIYEQKLIMQEKANQADVERNAELAKKIMKVRKFTEDVSTLTEKEQKLVRSRRERAATMHKELSKGQQQLNRVLENIPSLDIASSQEEEPASFLEITEGRGRHTREESEMDLVSPETVEQDYSSIKDLLEEPSEMEAEEPSERSGLSNVELGLSQVESVSDFQVRSLAANIAKLHKSAAETLAKLKESFDEGYEAGSKRGEALHKQHSSLKDALESGKKQALKLKAEYTHVTGLRKHLDKQLAKNDAFLRNLVTAK